MLRMEFPRGDLVGEAKPSVRTPSEPAQGKRRCCGLPTPQSRAASTAPCALVLSVRAVLTVLTSLTEKHSNSGIVCRSAVQSAAHLFVTGKLGCPKYAPSGDALLAAGRKRSLVEPKTALGEKDAARRIRGWRLGVY